MSNKKNNKITGGGGIKGLSPMWILCIILSHSQPKPGHFYDVYFIFYIFIYYEVILFKTILN